MRISTHLCVAFLILLGMGVSHLFCQEEDEKIVDIVPEEVCALKGRVLGEQGKGLSDVTVERISLDDRNAYFLLRQRPDEAEWVDTTLCTDEDGGFSLKLPPKELGHTCLRLTHPSYMYCIVKADQAVSCLDGSYSLGRLPLKVLYFIQGRVLTSEGAPVAGCEVSPSQMPWEAKEYRIYGYKTTLTDGEGRFKLGIPFKRSMAVTAFKEGVGLARRPSVTPGKGDEVPEVELRLSRSGTISGILMDSNGEPVKGVPLLARSDKAEYKVERKSESQEDGVFTIDNLPMDCRYLIKACHMTKPCDDELRFYDFLTLAEDIPPDTKNLELCMPAGVDLLITFSSVNGESVVTDKPRFYLMTVSKDSTGSVKSASGDEWKGLVEQPAPGAFLLKGVSPGTYVVVAFLDGYRRTAIHDVEVPEFAGQVDCSASLIPAGCIEGRVLFEDGTPAAGVTIQIDCAEEELYKSSSISRMKKFYAERIPFNSHGIRVRSSRGSFEFSTKIFSTDSLGRFVHDQAENGKYFLVFGYKGNEVHEIDPILLTDEVPNKNLEVILPPIYGVIEGKVRDAAGKPVNGAHVVAWNGKNLFNITRSDEEGDYRFDGLSDGKYIVNARCIQYSGNLAGRNSREYDHDKTDLEAMGAFNAELTQSSVCRLDLTIRDPWSAKVLGRTFSPGGGTMPPRHRVKLEEWSEDGKRRSGKYSYADLFEYNRELSTQKIADGESFLFEDIRAGLYRLQVNWVSPVVPAPVSNPHHYFIPVGWSRAREIDLPAAMVMTEDFELALSSIRGTVVDRETFEPIPGATVEMIPKAEENTDYTVSVTVGKDGAFEIHALPSGPFELNVRHWKYEPFGPVKIEFRDNQDRSGVCLRLGLKEED